MMSAKKIAGFLVIAIGFFASLFIFALGKVNDFWGEDQKLTALIAPSTEEVPSSTRNIAAELGLVTSTNMTDLLAGAFAEQLLNLNPQGPQDFDSEKTLLVPGNVDLRKFIEAHQEAFDLSNLSSVISDEELELVENSQENFAYYLSEIEKIETAMDEALPRPTEVQRDIFAATRLAQEIAVVFANSASSSKNLAAPRSIFPLHKRYVELLLGLAKSLAKGSMGETDPFGGIMALQYASAIHQELVSLRGKMVSVAEEGGFKTQP